MASFHHAHHQHGHTDHQATRVDYKHDEAVQSTCPEIAKKIIMSNGLYNDLNLRYSLIKEVIFAESMRIHYYLGKGIPSLLLVLLHKVLNHLSYKC